MTKRIDKELLRKRAEHNDGELSTLKEITLHQYDIEKIESLDRYCKDLEILFLQNNQISKIENLHKLKKLKYLQLALNNIRKLENLEGCESLEKLDLTVNFIEDPLDVESLKGNLMLRELFLVGNPCARKEGYRDFVITALPQLTALDARDITKSERIIAAQVYDELRERFVRERPTSSDSAEGISVDASPSEERTVETEVPSESVEDELEKKRWHFQNEPLPHTPSTRLESARELAALNGEKEPSRPSEKVIREMNEPARGPDGRVLQRNQGKWPFRFETTKDLIVLHVELSKFLDSSLIDIDVHPTYIRILAKGKLLQLVLEEPVQTGNVLCERSRLTGELAVTMVKASVGKENVDVTDMRRRDRRASEQEHKRLERAQHREATSKPLQLTGPVDIRNIVSNGGKCERPSPNGILEVKLGSTKPPEIPDDFVDDPDVPPLC
ncbi:hypothetical protein BC832DRAFT_373159 [Gaertneriomyces semiglobifer]|nr:hypothetical protein BC832DRAFT_373159 [Gaertneriomyces semiglobifer]